MSLQERLIAGNTSLGEGTKLSAGVTIGRYCSIARYCTLGAEQHEYTQFTTWLESRDSITTIGHDVWIGCNVVVIAGVTIGTGAVIGAGSVVTHDIPPYAIAYGVPARVKKYRFPGNIVDALLSSKWWELERDVVEKLLRSPLDMIAHKDR